MGLYNRVESVPLLKNQKHLHQSKPQKKPRALSKLNALPAVYNTASPLLLNAPHVGFLKEVFTIRDWALHNMGRNHERKMDHLFLQWNSVLQLIRSCCEPRPVKPSVKQLEGLGF